MPSPVTNNRFKTVQTLADEDFAPYADGDAINVILCAAGHNMRLLVRWLRLLLFLIRAEILRGGRNHPDHQAPAIAG